MLDAVSEGELTAAAEPRRVRLTPEELATQFLPVLRAGLPVRPKTAGEYLPYFPIVLAHSKATDHLARVVGLDTVVTELLRDLPANDEGDALRILFAFKPAHRSWNLTHRQSEAAKTLGCSAEHMRKHRQADLLDDFTYEFIRRNERYKIAPARRVLLGEVPDAGAFDETDDLMLIEYQARCMTELYALRADLIAIRRLRDQTPTTTEQYVESSLKHYLDLQRLVREAIDRYGIGVRPDDPDSGLPALEVLLGGHGPFTDEEVIQLVAAASIKNEAHPATLVAKWREWAGAPG